MKHRKKHIWASIMILLIVAFDQVTKRLAESALMGGKIVLCCPVRCSCVMPAIPGWPLACSAVPGGCLWR